MTASPRAAATVALALIEDAPTDAAAEQQTQAARTAGASTNEIHRAWRHRRAARNYRIAVSS